MKTYTFHRAEGFYPLDLADDEQATKNAEMNPGTLRVEAQPEGRLVWSAEPLFTCSQCNKHFPPDPDTMLTATWVRNELDKVTDEADLPEDDLRNRSAEELHRMGLTEEQRDRLFAGETIKTAVCICIECQERDREEQHGDTPQP